MPCARPLTAAALVLPAILAGGCGGEFLPPGGEDPPLPTVTIISGPEALTNERRAELVLECDIEGCRMECDLNGTGWVSCGPSVVYEDLADREHLVWVRGLDSQDRVGTRAEWLWRVDTEAPMVVGVQGPPQVTSETSALFTFACSEADCSFECSLSGGPPEACEPGVTFDELEDGEHELSIMAEDPAGNVSVPALRRWRVDTTSPVIEGLVGPPDPTNRTTAGFDYACSEEGCSYTCVLDGEPQAVCEPGYHYGGQVGPARLDDGPHEFAVHATDAVGNVGLASVWTWTVDTVVPAVTELVGPESPSTDTEASLTFGCSKEDCAFECGLEGAVQGPIELLDSCDGAAHYGGLEDDEYVFTVVARDPAGNESPPAVWTWTVDTAPPRVLGLAGPADPSNSSEAIFTFGCSRQQCVFTCGLFGVGQGVVADEAACVSGVAYSGLADDDYTFTVVATDELGNQGPVSTWIWSIDTEVPQVIDLEGPPHRTKESDAVFSFGCSKDQCSFTCRLDSAAGGVGPEVPCQSGVDYIGLFDDLYTFNVRAADPAGNESDPATWTWNIDNTLPVVVFTEAPTAETWQSTAEFEFSCINKDDCVFECALGGAFAPCSSPHLITDLVPGDYLFQVRATDGAGNVGQHDYAWRVVSFDWLAIAAGRDHTCGIAANWSLWCWGDNAVGKLGDGTATSRSSPVRVGSATDWASIALGANHTCGIRADGSLWCWGSSWSGQLGVGTTDNSAYPLRVGTGLDWEQVSAGYAHTCGRKSDGSLWCWGNNGEGRLGDGTSTSHYSPIQVGSALDWVSVAAGSTHTCGSRAGSLWCWGANWSGQLGDGTTTTRRSPVQVGSFVDWTEVSLGEDQTCATRVDGSLWCWGTNWGGQLGDGTIMNRHAPVRIGTDLDWEEVSAGLHHTCGRRAGGGLWCWGKNDSGQLGDGTGDDRLSPTRVGTASDWARVSSGGGHTCAMRDDDSPWCWGFNHYGQLGEGTNSGSWAPVPVGPGSN